MALIQGFLKQDIMEDMKRWTPISGSPQGAVISPLLANLYLHELDVEMREAGSVMVRYADDAVVSVSYTHLDVYKRQVRTLPTC